MLLLGMNPYSSITFLSNKLNYQCFFKKNYNLIVYFILNYAEKGSKFEIQPDIFVSRQYICNERKFFNN